MSVKCLKSLPDDRQSHVYSCSLSNKSCRDWNWLLFHLSEQFLLLQHNCSQWRLNYCQNITSVCFSLSTSAELLNLKNKVSCLCFNVDDVLWRSSTASSATNHQGVTCRCQAHHWHILHLASSNACLDLAHWWLWFQEQPMTWLCVFTGNFSYMIVPDLCLVVSKDIALNLRTVLFLHFVN